MLWLSRIVYWPPLPSMESLETVSHFLAEILQVRGELFPTIDTPGSGV